MTYAPKPSPVPGMPPVVYFVRDLSSRRGRKNFAIEGPDGIVDGSQTANESRAESIGSELNGAYLKGWFGAMEYFTNNGRLRAPTEPGSLAPVPDGRSEP